MNRINSICIVKEKFSDSRKVSVSAQSVTSSGKRFVISPTPATGSHYMSRLPIYVCVCAI